MASAHIEEGIVPFDAYVRERSERLQRTAWLVVRDWHDARDAVQDALVALYPRWDQLPAGDRQHAYVHRSVVNACLTLLRHRRTRPVADPDALPEPTSTPDHADAVTDAHTIWRWCADLPPVQRAVIALRYHADLSYTDIAAALDCREATARSHVHRALAALRANLTEEDAR